MVSSRTKKELGSACLTSLLGLLGQHGRMLTYQLTSASYKERSSLSPCIVHPRMSRSTTEIPSATQGQVLAYYCLGPGVRGWRNVTFEW